MSMTRFVSFCAVASVSSVSMANIVLFGFPVPAPPPGIYAVDVLADLTPEDRWTAGGLAGQTFNGAAMRHGPTPINPGNANQFVTMFSEPFAQANDPHRFSSSGASVQGAYSPPGPVTVLTGATVNIQWSMASAPAIDGWIARIALDLTATGFTNAQVGLFAGSAAPPGTVLLFLSSTANQLGTAATTSFNSAWSGGNWGVFGVPSPSSLCLLAGAGIMGTRRRRSDADAPSDRGNGTGQIP